MLDEDRKKLTELWNAQLEDPEQWEEFVSACKELIISEEDLRQVAGMMPVSDLGVLVFDQMIECRQFSKDFLREYFSNCSKRVKDTLQFVFEMKLNDFNFDLVKEDLKKVSLNFLSYRNVLKNICKYLYYCNPVDKRVLDIYYKDFKYNEIFKTVGVKE